MSTTQTIRRDSARQIAVFDAIKNTNSNIAILATAGSGKTTTGVKALSYIPVSKKTAFLSFSNAIVEELKKRVPFNVNASTLHSLGFGMIRRYYKGRFVELITDGNKYFRFAVKIYKDALPEGTSFLDKKQYRAAKLVNEVCNYARMTLTPNTIEALGEMCIHFNIDFDKQILENSQLLLEKALYAGNKKVMIDFIDMIYFPAMMPEMVDEKYDYIMLDEAQDTNAMQLQLVENILAANGRLISFGDDWQCIYGFSGADVDAFKRIRERPNTIELPLSVSYRCPQLVVKKAQEICETIEPWEEAEVGEEREGTWQEINENDIVLSRTTKPLIGLYFLLLEKGVRAKVVGKDMETGLVDLAELCMSSSKEGFVYKCEQRFEELKQQLEKDGIIKVTEHPKWRALEEKYQILTLILNKVDKTSEIVPLIKDMFHDKKAAARLMTIHRSKGLENDRVFLITKANGVDLMPSKWAEQAWEKKQETNLMFVAYTRAKKALIHINTPFI